MSTPSTILVVEDDPITQAITCRALEQAGFRTMATAQGAEALAILRSDVAIDWLVTDINLDDLTNGWVVGAEFHLAHPQRTVIFTSAAGMPPVASKAVCLAKPYDPATLVELLERLVREEAPLLASAPEPSPRPERRLHPRLRSMLRGQIIYNNRCSTVDCVVRDLTPAGARLAFALDASLPAVFELSLPLRGRRHQARIIWRREGECGVHFVG